MEVIKVNNEITLKQIEISDAKDIFETIDSQREYLRKWLPFVDNTKKMEDTKNYITYINTKPKNDFVFVIHYNKKFVGLISLKNVNNINKKAGIGYWISEVYQKKGIVTQSLQFLITFAFNKLDINRLEIKCGTENTSSKNIPKRLNFKFEGVERDGEISSNNQYIDLEIYSKLKREANV